MIIISLTEKINKLPEVVLNWNEVPNNVKELFSNCTDFRHNGQELLLYNGRQIIASCTIDLDYYDNIIIIDCWTKQGNIFK